MLTNNASAQGRSGRCRQPARRQPLRPHHRDHRPTGRSCGAATFKWEILVKCGDPSVAAVGATFNPGDHARTAGSACPTICAIDALGRLWISTDGNYPKRTGAHDGLWAMETEGPARGTSKLFFRCPNGAEMCGPEFTPDDETLFLAVQHPGEDDEDDPKAAPATLRGSLDPLARLQAGHAAAPLDRRHHQEGRRQDRGLRRCVTASSDRELLQRADGCHDAADLGEAAQAADGRIAGMGLPADIVEQFVAMIRAQRNAPIRDRRASRRRFCSCSSVRMTATMSVSPPRWSASMNEPSGSLRDIAQMGEMDVPRKALRQCRHIVA